MKRGNPKHAPKQPVIHWTVPKEAVDAWLQQCRRGSNFNGTPRSFLRPEWMRAGVPKGTSWRYTTR